MSKLMDVLIEATEAFIENDTEKYMSCMSERTKEVIERLGGIDSFMELGSIGMEQLGEEAVRELTLATIDQYILVDGKLENVSLAALTKIKHFDALMEQAKEGLDNITEFLSEE